MKTRSILFAGAIVAVAGFLTGCEQIQVADRVDPVQVSPFLERKDLLVRQKATFPFHYFYLKKDAGTYENIYIAPVNLSYLRKNEAQWAKLDEKMAKTLGSDLQKIADFAREAFKKEFAQTRGAHTLKVVESPDQPKTLIVELAIISIVPTKAELNILGTAGNLLLPGIGIITGKLAGGSVSLECKITDAQTKEIISMFANTERDQRAILNIAGMTWYTSAENNIKKQADYTARVFSGKDYSKVYRRLIKIVSL